MGRDDFPGGVRRSPSMILWWLNSGSGKDENWEFEVHFCKSGEDQVVKVAGAEPSISIQVQERSPWSPRRPSYRLGREGPVQKVCG